MKRFAYSPNAWPYHRVPDVTMENLVRRTIGLGFDAFDVFVGTDSIPDLAIDSPDATFHRLRDAAAEAGGRIGSVMMIGCPLQDEARCAAEWRETPRIVRALGTDTVHLLPRKPGMTQEQGFAAFARLWANAGEALASSDLTVTVENHAIAPQPDDDLFLLRTSADLARIVKMTSGRVTLKFDPAWLMVAGEEPLPALRRLLPHVAVLDLKDVREGSFVTPGTGDVDFHALARIARDASIRHIGVEVEEHCQQEPPITDPVTIDALHVSALQFYHEIFEQNDGQPEL